jgi:hypothetical protein
MSWYQVHFCHWPNEKLENEKVFGISNQNVVESEVNELRKDNGTVQSGWPDVFVKKLPKDNEKLPQKSPNHVFVKFTI